MNSKDLNSINEAFVQATTKVVAEKTTESGENVNELVGGAIKTATKVAGAGLKGLGYVAQKAGQAVAGAGKWTGDKFDKRRDRKKAEKKADKKYKKIEGAEEGSETDPLGIGKTKELSGATRDVKKKGRHTTKTDKKAEKKADKKTAKKESVTKIREADFGDASRHGDDMLDQDLKPGDFVKVDGEDGEWVVVDIEGDPNDPNSRISLGEVGPEGVTVSRNDVVKVSDDDADVSDPGDDAGDWQGQDDPFGDSVKTMMDDYEARLSSNFGVKKVHEKDESGTTFKQPDEKISEIDSKTQRPKGEVKADEKSKDVGDVKDDLQEPVEADEKDDKKEKKVVKESINNSNKGNIMSEDKSIFDKLYEQVMGEDDEFGGGDELGLPNGDGLDDVGDEFGDEGEDEVTVTLSPDQVDALKAVVDQFPSPEDDEEFGLGDGEEPADDENFESVEEGDTQTTGKPTSDGTKPGVDPSDGGGKTTDPASDSLGGKSSGTGQAKVTDDDATTGKETGEGKKPGTAKNSGKPGKLKAASKT